MQILQDIIMLLEERLGLFLEFERYTSLLIVCDIDDMADYITNRDELANKIDNVTAKISVLTETVSLSPSVESILANSCDFSEVPAQWRPVFSSAQHVRAVVSRCNDLNLQALERMTFVREHLKNRIAQTLNTPRLIKYISSSGIVQQEQDSRVSNKRI